MTLVYGQNTATKRMNLRNLLRSLAARCTTEWIILGDFIAVLSHEDRANGCPVVPHETADFQQCIDDIGVGQL